MFSKSKYVAGICPLSGQRFAVVFPETIQHVAMEKLFQHITSAGFCHYEESDVKVYGESVGLRIKSSPIDIEHVGRAMAHPKYII